MSPVRDILFAFGRALRSLVRRDVFWHLLWPGLVSMAVWLIVAVWSWFPLIATIVGWVESWPMVGEWLGASDTGAAVALILIKIAVVLAFLPLIYVTAALLVAVVALPAMLERVALRDYADLEKRRGGSNLGSAWNAFMALLLFIVGLVVSLPFWLIPGVGLIASVLLTAWLNQKAFGYDALMLHADALELGRLPKEKRLPMLMLGSGCAVLAYIPFINVVAPAFSGLAFVHFMLDALRQERNARGVTVLDPVAGELPRGVK